MRLIPEETQLYLAAGPFQFLDPAPGNARIGILQGNDASGDAGSDQCLGTGRRLAMMGARLKGDIGGAAASSVAGLAQGLGFGVRPPALLRDTASDDDAGRIENDAADGRIGPNAA
jgi:hypothetical protein